MTRFSTRSLFRAAVENDAVVIVSETAILPGGAQLSLTQTEALLARVFHASPHGMALVDADDSWLMVNPAFCELLGYSLRQIGSLTLPDIIDSQDYAAIEVLVQAVRVGKMENLERQVRVFGRNGIPIPVALGVATASPDGENSGRLLVQMIDLSAQIKQESELQKRASILELGTQAGAWDWNVTTNATNFSPRVAPMLGVAPEALKPHFFAWSDRIHPDDAPQFWEDVEEHLKGAAPSCEFEVRLRHGQNGAAEYEDATENQRWIWVRGRAQAMHSEGERPDRVFAAFTDVSHEKELQLRVAELSVTDAATALYSRHHFERLLNGELDRLSRYATRFSLVMCDLDYFARINSGCGPEVADSVLRDTALLLQRRLRRGDILGRVGGDQFAIIAANTTADSAGVLARSMKRVLSSHFFPEVGPVSATWSVVQATPDESAEALLERASRMLRGAKAEGRNRIVSESDEQVNVSEQSPEL